MKNRLPAIILASASPRRRAILARLGVPFAVEPADVDERVLPDEAPRQTALRVALAKARAAVAAGARGIVLGADTIVVLDGAILGKPGDREEALGMLHALRGRSHRVITAMALLNQVTGRTHMGRVTTRVRMRRYTEEEIVAYVASGDPFDKAGGYAIQSLAFHPVERIKGCYFNVVGLPLCEVVKGLVKVGYPRPDLPIDRLDTLCPHDLIGQLLSP